MFCVWFLGLGLTVLDLELGVENLRLIVESLELGVDSDHHKYNPRSCHFLRFGVGVVGLKIWGSYLELRFSSQDFSHKELGSALVLSSQIRFSDAVDLGSRA